MRHDDRPHGPRQNDGRRSQPRYGMGRRVGGVRRMKLLLVIAAAIGLHAQNVMIETTAGKFVIEVHRDWAPHGADRFLELVKSHYYDDSRFFRVVPGRWAQFGIAGDPKIAQAWRNRTIKDDVLKQHNTIGY